MQALLPLVPAPALLGFCLLALIPSRLPRAVTIGIGLAGGGLPLLLLGWIGADWWASGGPAGVVVPILDVKLSGLSLRPALLLDRLSLLAGLTVGAVGALVLLYAAAYMAQEPGRDLRRFFALMLLFLAGMLCFVLAGDAVPLFLGWEMIGLCSFFLIAFHVAEPPAGAAGRKAFVMTRIADALLLAGLLLLALAAGSTRLDAMLAALPTLGPGKLAAIAGLIAAGALGKSAQLPFQGWLPSAMTGPTPVSALLHSATMVGAGVLLLARLAPLLAAVPAVAATVAGIGLATALLAALAALVQRDVKKLLAFSTISQIGFMMLALGLGAPAAALAHFTAHAAFKSLLFLSAGAMGRAAGGATALAALRGARQRSPLGFWAFAAGAGSLAGLPLLTAGWFSKEAVLGAAWASGPWGGALWAVAVLVAVLTGAYAGRAVWVAASLARARPPRPNRAPWGGLAVAVPLLLLATAALAGGPAIGWLLGRLGGAPPGLPLPAILAGAAAPCLGAGLGCWLAARPRRLAWLAATLRPIGAGRFDALVYLVFVRGFRRLAARLAGADPGGPQPRGDLLGHATVATAQRLTGWAVAPFRHDPLDLIWMRAAAALAEAATAARQLQTGRLRDYATALALGTAGLLLFAWGTAWR